MEEDDSVGIQLTLMRLQENMEASMMRRIGEMDDKSDAAVALEVVPALMEAIAGELYKLRKDTVAWMDAREQIKLSDLAREEDERLNGN